MDCEPKNMNPMAAQPQQPVPTYYQPLVQSPPQQPQVLCGQPQVLYGQPQTCAGYVAVQQPPIAINIVGSGAAAMNPTNDCVLCLSVFACVCCEGALGLLALTLALVARVFHPDPANAVKAATLNRYAFRIALAAISLGVVCYVLVAILYGTTIANLIAAINDSGRRSSSSSSGSSYGYQSRYN